MSYKLRRGWMLLHLNNNFNLQCARPPGVEDLIFRDPDVAQRNISRTNGFPSPEINNDPQKEQRFNCLSLTSLYTLIEYQQMIVLFDEKLFINAHYVADNYYETETSTDDDR